MWEQLELQVRFCKLKCTQSQGSLHQILKWKRIFSHRDRRWWLTLPTSQVWILVPSCQGGHHQNKPNGHKSNNDPRPFLSNLCKSVQDFTKLNPQESSTDFDLQNPEISSTMELPRASMRHYRLRRLWPPPSLLCKLGHQFRKQKLPLNLACPDLTNLKIASLKMAARTSTRYHRPAMTNGLAP